ncbi:hypothetical protein [Tautonia marina]|uniref:hypothetical protein n=1 Tax=Tautonia marina TaxID=2653855 RepID=UPI001260CFF7|nr:hypothetical protein [Tautonia marina]
MKNKTSEYRYVILDYNGNCWLVQDNATQKTSGLPSMLDEGWVPVRETPFHTEGTVTPYVLILLERDGAGAGNDFGFA